ncbi:PAS domain-containing protein [Methylobacterium sp. WSM2598]|uniref:PAS domain-containing protein n=1 Tax=Methylobacterium sp. WSM2598 TaxID=398261 RepID=UPI002E809043|nr:PAS domain-containing protein [Methylobacterium sp. WSM2598]
MTRMPMILTDPRQPANPIILANRAFQDLTGYDEEELLGRNCRLLQGARTSRATVDEMRDALRDRRAIATEILNDKRDGTAFWNSVLIGPVYDEAGDLLCFFASQLDLSRRWASEQAQRQAQRMEAIGELTAALAHDFNNLLQVVTGNLDMALQAVTEERPVGRSGGPWRRPSRPARGRAPRRDRPRRRAAAARRSWSSRAARPCAPAPAGTWRISATRCCSPGTAGRPSR